MPPNRHDVDDEYVETELGLLPREWDVMRLGEILAACFDYRGRTPKKLGLNWGGGSIRALSANNVQQGRINFDKECYLGSEVLYARWMTHGDIERGDVIFTMEAPLGNVARVPDSNRYILSQRVVMVRPQPKVLDRGYFYHQLMSNEFQRILRTRATGTTATGIQRAKLVLLPLRIPPLPEQRRIAAVLDTVDEATRATEAVIAKLKQMKAGLLHDLLTRGVDDNGELRDPQRHPEQFKQTELGLLPREWEVVRLGDVARVRRGASPRPIDSPLWFATDGPGWIRISDVTASDAILLKTEQRLSRAGVAKSVRVAPGQVIMSICATVGEPIVVGLDACIHDGFVVFDRYEGSLEPEFLIWALRSRQSYFRGQGQTGTQANLNTGIVNRTAVPLPPLPEQRRIAAVLDDHDARIRAEDEQLDKLRKLKTGLMHDLLTGRVRVETAREPEVITTAAQTEVQV